MQKPESRRVGWDGTPTGIIQIVNNMLAESGIVDRKFSATPLDDGATRIGMTYLEPKS